MFCHIRSRASDSHHGRICYQTKQSNPTCQRHLRNSTNHLIAHLFNLGCRGIKKTSMVTSFVFSEEERAKSYFIIIVIITRRKIDSFCNDCTPDCNNSFIAWRLQWKREWERKIKTRKYLASETRRHPRKCLFYFNQFNSHTHMPSHTHLLSLTHTH